MNMPQQTSLMRQILATTDVNSMARTMHEAYTLTKTLERDIAQIAQEHESFRLAEANLHTEIMAGLENDFADRRASMSFIQEMIKTWVSEGRHDDAKQATFHMMELLKVSPSQTAMQRRNSFYRR